MVEEVGFETHLIVDGDLGARRWEGIQTSLQTALPEAPRCLDVTQDVRGELDVQASQVGHPVSCLAGGKPLVQRGGARIRIVLWRELKQRAAAELGLVAD